jgi:hypothetical protein
MSQQKPKRPPRRSKRLNVSVRAQWEKILKTVEKNDVPITVLDCVVVNLKDSTKVEVNIKQLLAEGYDPGDLQKELTEKLDNLDNYIEDVDFYINIEQVASTVQPITDALLKNL